MLVEQGSVDRIQLPLGSFRKVKRDVIFYSGRTWEMFAAPHRIALALAELGCKVLFCEAPVSPLRKAPRPGGMVDNGVCLFQPAFLSSRINRIALARDIQAKGIIRQIEQATAECELRDPIFLHAYAGDSGAVCRHMRKKYFAVHVSTDYAPGFGRRDQDYLAEMSDQTLVIPKSRFHQLRARFGDKITLIPQAVDFSRLIHAEGNGHSAVPADIPRPRLSYFGLASQNLNRPLLASLLKAHPDWHFVSVGTEKAVPLPNAHAVPWLSPGALASYIESADIGFMPYDCYDEERLHCVPLKMFEYFAFGVPVVSTPLIHLWEYKDLIYFGDTAEELASAVEAALDEPLDSPKRVARIEIARNHSIEKLATVLRGCLPLDQMTARDDNAGSARCLWCRSANTRYAGMQNGPLKEFSE